MGKSMLAFVPIYVAVFGPQFAPTPVLSYLVWGVGAVFTLVLHMMFVPLIKLSEQ